MNELQPYYQYDQIPFGEDHSYSQTPAHVISKRHLRRKKQKERKKLGQNKKLAKRKVQNKWCSCENEIFVYNSRQSQERICRNFRNGNYYVEHRGDNRPTSDMGSQQSIDNHEHNNETIQGSNNRIPMLDQSKSGNFQMEQSPLPQRQRSDSFAPKKTYFSENDERTNDKLTPPNVVENSTSNFDFAGDVVLNIKTEKEDNEPQKDKSSSSSSSDSNDNSVDSAENQLHTVVNSVISSKKPHQPKINIKKEKDSSANSMSSDSSSDSDTKTENPLKKSYQSKANIKQEKASSSSSTSSDSSADSNSETQKTSSAKTAPAKKSSLEGEVICFGRMERKQSLVDDKDEDLPWPMEDEKVYFLCEEPGHVAFQCFMVCNNCNGKYHGLRNCPKPPNIALVLQFFMQFCMDQACKYNPSNKFSIDGFQQINPQIFSNFQGSTESMANNSTNRKRRNSNDAGSSVSKASRRRREDSSTEESESSCDENIKRKAKRRSKSISDFDVQPQMSFTPAAYSAALPFAFNPSAMGMNPAMNPLLALGQMMGYNSPSIKRTGKSKKK